MTRGPRAVLYGLAGGLAAGLGFRFVAGDSIAFSVVTGIAIAAMLMYLLLRDAERRGREELYVPPWPVFSIIVGVGGVVIMLLGAASGSSSVVLAGLPLAALGAVLLGLTVWQRRTK